MMNSVTNHQSILQEYFPILVFALVAFGFSCLLILLGHLRGQKKPYKEKNSSYECGFNPLSKSRIKFDIRFYLVAILFVIFDLEIAFLFPWAVTFKEQGIYGFWSMIMFLFVLTAGFIYEWAKGALDWE